MDQAELLLQRIRRERIRPVPKTVVVARRAAWLLLFVAVFGLLCVSFASFFQELHAHAGRGWMFRVVLSQAAPWIWGVTAILFGALAYAVFRELPRAWRLRPAYVVLAILVAGSVTGFVMERGDVLLGLHRMVAHAFPSYRSVWQGKMLRVWHDPANGRLGGRLEDGSITAFGDVEGKRWTLRWVAPAANPPRGALRLQGRVCGDSVFCARRWKPAPGEGMRQGTGFSGNSK